MSKPRMLLVEDDAMVRRFVCMALEDQPIELVQAPTLAAARQALSGPPFALVLCDLMLPDGSGMDLLRTLAAADATQPRPHLVAFSAGISGAVRQQLHLMGVRQVLRKPVGLADLLACAQQAQTPLVEVAAQASAPQPWPDAAAVGVQPSSADVAAAVQHFFGGDAQRHAEFAAQCQSQFSLDLALGEQALSDGDLVALGRLAHSLKSLLLTLGWYGASELAARLETAATQRQAAESRQLWAQLSGCLLDGASRSP